MLCAKYSISEKVTLRIVTNDCKFFKASRRCSKLVVYIYLVINFWFLS